MSNQTERCNRCGADGRVHYHADYIDEQGSRRGRNGVRLCEFCNGTKVLPLAVAQRLRRGEELREERLGRGVNVRKEAARLGVTPSFLSRIENGSATPEQWQEYDAAVEAADKE
jgi:ribosome-binding protein aMBF1 (putative translation factor)